MRDRVKGNTVPERRGHRPARYKGRPRLGAGRRISAARVAMCLAHVGGRNTAWLWRKWLLLS